MKSARIAFGLFAACAYVSAHAATFSINPTRVELDAKRHSDSITINNTGTEPLRMQVRTMRWTAAADGQWQLTPSDDLVVTPELVEVPAGKTAVLRVGNLLDAGNSEASYRLLLNELPNLDSAKTAPLAQVRVLTEVSLPVFVEPPQTSRVPVLRSAVMARGALTVNVGNDGTQRIDPQSVHVSVTDHAGHVLDQRDVMANYVLPGNLWPMHIALPSRACAQAAAVTVSWNGVVNNTLTRPISSTGNEACEGKSSP